MDNKREDSDEIRDQELVARQEKAWESQCTRCGACCGSTSGDPCENLIKTTDGQYGCRIYETRFGERKTISGKTFQCVPLRWIIHQRWEGDELCGYKKKKSGDKI